MSVEKLGAPHKKVCPFYKNDDEHSLSCAGIAQKSEFKMWFVSPTAKRKHMEMFCYGSFFRCPYAVMLNRVSNQFKVRICRHNRGVECADFSGCSSCGWNPQVAQDRLDQYLTKKENKRKKRGIPKKRSESVC